jgi:hypothetical protein
MSSILDAVKKDPERASGTGFGPLPDGFDAPGGSGGPPPGRPRTLVVAAVVLVGLAVGALASRWASGPSQVAETLVASLPEAATEAAPAPAEPTAAEPPAAVAPEAEEQAAGERPHPPKHEKKVKGEGGKPAAKAERPPKAPAARVKTGADPVAAAPAEVAPAAAGATRRCADPAPGPDRPYPAAPRWIAGGGRSARCRCRRGSRRRWRREPASGRARSSRSS